MIELFSESENEWTDKWMTKERKEWMNEAMKEWINERTNDEYIINYSSELNWLQKITNPPPMHWLIH